MTNEQKFYIGQEVLCLVHGYGKIVDIVPNKIVPIFVHFEKGGLCMYTLAGEVSPSAGQTLFDRNSFEAAADDNNDAFYVGEDVECLAHGPGKVVHIFKEKGAAFPVQVEFERGVVSSYSHSGKMSMSAQRTLFPKGSAKLPKKE